MTYVSHYRRDTTHGRTGLGLRELLTGILGGNAILGLVLALLGFAAAFGLAEAVEATNGAANDAQQGAGGIAVLAVSLLPILAAPLVALAAGAWAGHASRDSRVGALAGALGGFFGPLVATLIMGIGFALGAGAAGIDLGNVRMPYGVSPAWGGSLPELFTTGGITYLLANALGGGLMGALVGWLMERFRGVPRTEVVDERASTRV